MNETPSANPENRKPTSVWVTRVDTVAAFVLAVIFLVWVGTLFIRQRLTGGDVRVLQSEGAAATYRVDLNRADVNELTLLPGIGEVRAGRILDWRAEHEPFRSLDEVRQATGLSASGIERLRGLVTLGEQEAE